MPPWLLGPRAQSQVLRLWWCQPTEPRNAPSISTLSACLLSKALMPYNADCYRNPLGGWKQWMGATFVVGRLVWAWNIRFRFLLYCFWCCQILHLAHLVFLRVLLSWFCSSTVELHYCQSLYASLSTSFSLCNLPLRMLIFLLALPVPYLPLSHLRLHVGVWITL